MTGPDFVKARDLPVDPMDSRLTYLYRMSILRGRLTPEEQIEFDQLLAAEKVQRRPDEVAQ